MTPEYIKRMAAAQQDTHVHCNGVPFRRIAYGQEVANAKEFCRDCGVAYGMPHVHRCCIEQCAICESQRIGCDCEDEKTVEGGVWD